MSMVATILVCASVASLQPTTSAPVPASPEHLRTTAERTNFEATSTHAEVVALMDALAKEAPQARRASMGTTVEGREIPLLICSDPPVASASEARALAEREGRPIVLIFANIHAGEVDAKEAVLMLARELVLGPERPLLGKLVVVLAPIYNCDGNERFGEAGVNRPGQDGPVRGMGMRHNAMDLDLNRDFGKLESPEARAFVRFLNDWDPHVVVDGHTTDGSYHRYLITYAGPKVPAADPRLIEFGRDRMLPEIGRALRARTDIDTFFYGDFVGDHENPPRPHAAWTMFPATARYSTGYLGLRGRIGILSESYSYSPFKDRILGTLEFCREILRYTAAHATEVRSVTAGATRAGAGADGLLGDIAIRSKPAPAPEKAPIKGYVEETREGRAVSTNQPAEYECEVLNRFEPALSVTRPAAYVFTTAAPKVVENLRLHGVRAEALEQDADLDAEVYTIDSIKPASRAWQGHTLVEVEATPTRKTLRVPKGAMLVRTDQPLGNLIVYWLEPECEDGLTTWNFFDEWLKPEGEFPVARVLGALPQTAGATPSLGH